MALRMVALVRAKDGNGFARKGIPEDVRDPYQLQLKKNSRGQGNRMRWVAFLDVQAHCTSS
jgi:hypothetical protein